MTQIELTSQAAPRRDGFTAALKVPILAMLGATAFAASFVLLDTMVVLGAQVAGATLLALAALVSRDEYAQKITPRCHGAHCVGVC